MEKPETNEKAELLTDAIGFHPRKLWFTFRELMIRPGPAIADYCRGERKNMMSPAGYFLLVYGLFFLIAEWTGFLTSQNSDANIPQLAEMFKDSFKANPKLNSAFLASFPVVFSKNVFVFVYLPCILVTWWLLFRGKQRPFLHHLYLVLFMTAQTNIISSLSQIVYLVNLPIQWVDNWYGQIVSAVYAVLVARPFYVITYREAILKVLAGQYLLIWIPMAFFLAAAHAIVTGYFYLF